MHKYDSNRIKFYPASDLACWSYLSEAEFILKKETKPIYEDVNDIMELYNIKKYIDSKLYLKSWTQEDISFFNKKANGYGKIIGQFMSKINDNNLIAYYEKLLQGYICSFWELLSNFKIYEQISAEKLSIILSNEPNEIYNILIHKNLVINYDTNLRDFLLNYPQSAEILLSIYEENRNKDMFLPKNLSIKDKEDIISKYLDMEFAHPNYFNLIQNARNQNDFKISDKIRLKAKQRCAIEKEKIFSQESNISKYGVSVSFLEKIEIIKQVTVENMVCKYSYSLDYIKQNNDNFSLFYNFNRLFEYLDEQGRINLVVRKKYSFDIWEFIGIHSKNEYIIGVSFNLSEMTSSAQITAYSKIINGLENSLENILEFIFTSFFQEKYNFANNARIIMPSVNFSYLEKVRFLAPEFESILKQYKLFVENNNIDFDLLQITSSPYAIKEIPSLISDKYIYLNDGNKEIIGCLNLLLSRQATLNYIEHFKEKNYDSLFDLLINEQVNYNYYEDSQKTYINYLIDKGILFLDENQFIQITNNMRMLILKDLYENEVASFYHYSSPYQEEVIEMKKQGIIVSETSLFSRPEQRYFNYFLNKSEFTNGLDIRNSYVHGTQANPEETKKHEYAYFTYLKLLVLVLLKIDDDLFLSLVTKEDTK
jgi:hypothetical protein